jgi:hypothetical protein
VVLHDHDLRSDCLDDLDSVVDEMKVVVRENGDLDCVRKSPEDAGRFYENDEARPALWEQPQEQV